MRPQRRRRTTPFVPQPAQVAPLLRRHSDRADPGPPTPRLACEFASSPRCERQSPGLRVPCPRRLAGASSGPLRSLCLNAKGTARTLQLWLPHCMESDTLGRSCSRRLNAKATSAPNAARTACSCAGERVADARACRARATASGSDTPVAALRGERHADVAGRRRCCSVVQRAVGLCVC